MTSPISKLTDFELLRAWRGGDRRMGEELFERHKRAVINLLLRNVRSKDEVRDLLHETFLACSQASETEVAGSVRSYLLGIAFHMMTRFFRRERNAPKLGVDETTLASVEPDPEYLLVLSDEQRLLMTAIRRLKIEFQVVLELHYWEGVSCDEIAHVLGIPPGTARSRLRHARIALTGLLADLAEAPGALKIAAESVDVWKRAVQNWIAVHAAFKKGSG